MHVAKRQGEGRTTRVCYKRERKRISPCKATGQNETNRRGIGRTTGLFRQLFREQQQQQRSADPILLRKREDSERRQRWLQGNECRHETPEGKDCFDRAQRQLQHRIGRRFVRHRDAIYDRAATGLPVYAIRIVAAVGRLPNGTDRLCLLAKNVPRFFLHQDTFSSHDFNQELVDNVRGFQIFEQGVVGPLSEIHHETEITTISKRSQNRGKPRPPPQDYRSHEKANGNAAAGHSQPEGEQPRYLSTLVWCNRSCVGRCTIPRAASRCLCAFHLDSGRASAFRSRSKITVDPHHDL
mmetsp:Transcript_71958/g.145963  ORF Transcript_71958/g.145963 Transcript_71958/m.145963 type:complete len:296 (+) Transcript_71958:895-1782(+)